MGGENNKTDKIDRAYQRLIMAILKNSSALVLEARQRELEELSLRHVSLDELKRDAENYHLYYQCGREILVFKNSPLGKRLSVDSSKDDGQLHADMVRERFWKGSQAP